jgi:hypothetical protein
MKIRFTKEIIENGISLEDLDRLVQALKIKPKYPQALCGCGEGWSDERCSHLKNGSDCIFNYVTLSEQ